MKPSVSVIIPVYNGAAEVCRAIDSALAQKDCDVEVIVLNDGSWDETESVLAEYGDRIRAVNQMNCGLSKTRNNGIALATGEWVAFLDHDDYWQPGKLSLQLEAARRTGFDVVYTNAGNFGDVARVAELRSEPDAMAEGDLLEPLLLDNFIVVSSVMVRRSVIQDIGGFDTSLPSVEDWDLWLKLSSRGVRFAAVREPVTMYQWRKGSMSKNYELMRTTRQSIIQRALCSLRAKSLSWSVRRRALANIESCSAWFLAGSSPRKAIRWYMNSLWYWPFDVNSWKGVVKGCLGRS
ncbi:MAG TPA: glycosyltransferase [Planctomycetaceae bacterium]|nr:glycosyltransferase [Planctomycetaceae bacterium]HQZ64127.1 glycosyltransferase [Planctomycetaceae bacterium]